MTDLLIDLESYLVSKGITSPIYRDYVPDNPDNVVILSEYEGQSGIPQVQAVNRSIQIVARNISATAAKLEARALYNALVTEDGVLHMVSTRECVINLRQPPFRLKTDEAQRVHYSFNVGIITYND